MFGIWVGRLCSGVHSFSMESWRDHLLRRWIWISRGRRWITASGRMPMHALLELRTSFRCAGQIVNSDGSDSRSSNTDQPRNYELLTAVSDTGTSKSNSTSAIVIRCRPNDALVLWRRSLRISSSTQIANGLRNCNVNVSNGSAGSENHGSEHAGCHTECCSNSWSGCSTIFDRSSATSPTRLKEAMK